MEKTAQRRDRETGRYAHQYDAIGPGASECADCGKVIAWDLGDGKMHTYKDRVKAERADCGCLNKEYQHHNSWADDSRVLGLIFDSDRYDSKIIVRRQPDLTKDSAAS